MSIHNELIHIIDNKANPSAYAKTIIEFKNLKTEELAFIYFMEDHKIFADYGTDDQGVFEVRFIVEEE